VSASPELSVVITNYRRPELLRRCLVSVLAATAAGQTEVEVVVVDDGSGDESVELVRREFPGVQVIALAENRGYAGAVNAGIVAGSGEWVLTLNNDTTVDPEAFDRLLEAVRDDPSIGLAAAQQRFASDPGRIYSAGTVIDGRAHATDRLMGAPVAAGEERPVEVFGACGAAALYRRAMLEQVGGLDEQFRFGLEDADLAWRARMRGWRCLYVPAAIVHHELGGTIPHGSPERLFQAGRNRWLLIAKHLDGRELVRRLPAIVAFDLAYVAYAVPRFRTLAPIRGRIAGLALWHGARRAGAEGRVRIELPPPEPLRTALRRRRAWRLRGSSAKPHMPARNGRSIMFVNQYAPPDPASTGGYALTIASALAGGGDRVTFLAGQPSYHADLAPAPRREQLDGVELVRLEILGRGGRSSRAARLLGYTAFLVRSAAAGSRLARSRKVDTIVCFHNPPLLFAVGAFLARGGRRFVAVVFDIHPDVVRASGWIRLPRALIRAWEKANVGALTRADAVITLSDGMRQVLAEKGIEYERIQVIPIWAQPELEPRAPAPGQRERLGVPAGGLLVLFTGNLGVTQQLEPVARAAELLAGKPVWFVFVGTGVGAAELQRHLAGAANVRFLPFQDDAAYRELVHAADAAVVTLAPGLERLVVPSRAFAMLCAGVPLVAAMSPDSELGTLVRDYRVGVCSTDPATLAARIEGWVTDPDSLRLARRRARGAYLATRNRATLIQRYVEVVRGPEVNDGRPAVARQGDGGDASREPVSS
jgi:GT2 family glycosyltransferase/glycosyltransferase involved in cell wall biosynthesis